MIRRLRKRMTLAQLKRHMDRRFDRLEQTKADKTDLRRFATKRQVQSIRDDLTRFATKDDLRQLEARTSRQLESLGEKIDRVLKVVKANFEHHELALGEHEKRITDLERRAAN